MINPVPRDSLPPRGGRKRDSWERGWVVLWSKSWFVLSRLHIGDTAQGEMGNYPLLFHLTTSRAAVCYIKTTGDESGIKVTTSDHEWPRVTTSNHEWPQMTTNDLEWQRARLHKKISVALLCGVNHLRRIITPLFKVKVIVRPIVSSNNKSSERWDMFNCLVVSVSRLSS